jgi:hypothetical protein
MNLRVENGTNRCPQSHAIDFLRNRARIRKGSAFIDSNLSMNTKGAKGLALKFSRLFVFICLEEHKGQDGTPESGGHRGMEQAVAGPARFP